MTDPILFLAALRWAIRSELRLLLMANVALEPEVIEAANAWLAVLKTIGTRSLR